MLSMLLHACRLQVAHKWAGELELRETMRIYEAEDGQTGGYDFTEPAYEPQRAIANGTVCCALHLLTSSRRGPAVVVYAPERVASHETKACESQDYRSQVGPTEPDPMCSK